MWTTDVEILQDSFSISLQGLPTFSVYSHSYLGLGAWNAQQKYMTWLAKEYSMGTPDSQSAQLVVDDPCFVEEYSEVRAAGTWRTVRFLGSGNYDTCISNVLKSLVDIHAVCRTPPCSFGVLHNRTPVYATKVEGICFQIRLSFAVSFHGGLFLFACLSCSYRWNIPAGASTHDLRWT